MLQAVDGRDLVRSIVGLVGAGDPDPDIQPAIAIENIVAAVAFNDVAAGAAEQDVAALEKAVRPNLHDLVEAGDAVDTSLIEAVVEEHALLWFRR